jgi:hypothetical protein
VVGRVADTSGGAISQATVTVTNDDTGLVRMAITNPSGDINVLPIGRYTIRNQKEGFGMCEARHVRGAGDLVLTAEAPLTARVFGK